MQFFFAATSVTHVEERGGLLPFILERFHCVCCCVWLKSFQHFFYNLQLSHSLQWALLVHCKMHFNPLKALCWCLPWRSLFSRNWRMTDVCKIAFFSLASIPFEPWEFKHFCSLKIAEKVSFNIASEASYVYILSGQKIIKNAKNGPFWRVFENLKLAVKQCYQTGQF